MIRVKLTHLTEYTYDHAVALSPHIVRLRPAPHTRTHIESYSLAIEPEKKFLNWQQDPFSNWQARLVFPERARKLSVRVELVAQMQVFNPFDFFVEEYAETFPFVYEAALAKELVPYLTPSEDNEHIRNFVAGFKGDGLRIVDMVVAANRYIKDHVSYVIRLEPGVQAAAQTLELKSGSCRDSAYLLVQLFRHLGLAARFVSGYLIQLKSDGPVEEGGVTKDFTDLHAWAEVFIPGAGWVGLDATSGLLASEGHIPLAATPEPESAAAIQGFTEPCKVDFHFAMEVVRLSEAPRVTQPYTDALWSDVTALGKKLDRELKKSGMKLTIGGEPTFVSARDREGREWNFDALGENKFRLANELLSRFYEIYSQGGILMHSQGKWYPGEPLPRWSLDCFWRRDGRPLWKNPQLLGIGAPKEKKILSIENASALMDFLRRKLHLPPECVLDAYEDPAHYLHAEGKLPPEFEQEIKGNSYSEIERRRLLRILDQGLGEVAGFALPLRYNSTQKNWESAITVFRRGFLALLPGDSPMGLRLPLSSIAESFDPIYETDPLARSSEIAEAATHRGALRKNPVHTMLCAEVRENKLFVFLPPVQSVEEFISLLALIEEAAEALDLPLHLEGYEPPRDARLNSFRITPDPGVIEVNLFPSTTLKEAIEKTEIIYSEAQKLGLTTDRYLLDGRACATGGGNHITLGALNPEDSPFLRRPDILASLIAYWQNHPALSYVFSGLFIGPTSQAPRIDEARDENLYEAEIALKELRTAGKAAPMLQEVTGDGGQEALSLPSPWLVDRILRNVLTDMTGNTHRAEISIDKLYAPGSVTGRLGLVELRAFEMPPHYRMSCVQQLLVAALMLKFWHRPYESPLIRWGSALRDRWLLPHYLRQDLLAVLRDLRLSGFTFAQELLEPFFEFRFPLCGTYAVGGLQIELRMALEPWNVLGEETVSGNVSRSVDSAVERLQVSVRGFDAQKYVLTCNGHEIPLRHAENTDLHIAGIVFKAWAPPFTLHPTIGVHAPLNICVYDRAAKAYIGGCTYHVAHPGGRSHETYPVNAYEAESRRLARFTSMASMPKTAPEGVINPTYPHTLDLRLT